MLISISGSAYGHSPAIELTVLESWILACIVFVAAALFEYAVLLRIKYFSKEIDAISQVTLAAEIKRNELGERCKVSELWSGGHPCD